MRLCVCVFHVLEIKLVVTFKTKIDLNRENKQFEKTETELSQLDR